MHRLIRALLLAALAMFALGAQAQEVSPPANPTRGKTLIAQEGCGSCHEIRGIPGADGLVGPPLNNIGSRVMIAGMLPNRPPDLIRWLMSPQSIVPGNAMPDMGLTRQEAADIAAYLDTLR